jgi:hypothetical protein
MLRVPREAVLKEDLVVRKAGRAVVLWRDVTTATGRLAEDKYAGLKARRKAEENSLANFWRGEHKSERFIWYSS